MKETKTKEIHNHHGPISGGIYRKNTNFTPKQSQQVKVTNETTDSKTS